MFWCVHCQNTAERLHSSWFLSCLQWIIMKKKMPTCILYSNKKKKKAEVYALQSGSLESFFRWIGWISLRLGGRDPCYTLMITALFKSIYQSVSYIGTLCIVTGCIHGMFGYPSKFCLIIVINTKVLVYLFLTFVTLRGMCTSLRTTDVPPHSSVQPPSMGIRSDLAKYTRGGRTCN